MVKQKIRVLLADDHPVVRGGVRALLEEEDDIEVVGEAAGGYEALELVASLQPDILLLDMEMGDLNGVEVAKRLGRTRSGCKVLALSAHDDRHYIYSLLNAGAAGYLIKDEAPAFVVEAIRGVWRGQEGWLSRKVAAKMSRWMRQDGPEYGLTPREKEVLHAIAQGMTNQEAGLALGISDKTIEKHLESVFAKLGVSSRVEAAVLAVREGLVE